MRAFLTILAVGVSAIVGASTAYAKEYTVSAWPQGINELPCSVFRKNPNGSWTMMPMVHVIGGYSMMYTTFGGPPERDMIEKKCGSSSGSLTTSPPESHK